MTFSAADPLSPALDSIGTPTLWTLILGGVVVLLALDFLVTRRPHEVSMKEALGWSAFYVALPLIFGAYIWQRFGGERVPHRYLVEMSLSVDNLFVFMLLLGAFAVPKALQQRVLLYGIIGALVLRGIFIALGAAALSRFDWMFLVFGVILVLTAVKILRDALSGSDHAVDVDKLRSVRFVRRFVPVTETYEGAKMTPSPRSTGSPATRSSSSQRTPSPCWACARSTSSWRERSASSSTSATGLRRSLVSSAPSWPCTGGTCRSPSVPEIPTLVSLGVIVGILVVTTLTSLAASRRRETVDA